MDSRFGGRNCMPFGHDQILFLDIWHNDELLSYSTTLKMTTSFQPEVPLTPQGDDVINQEDNPYTKVLIAQAGVPTIMYLRKKGSHLLLTHVAQLATNSWEIRPVESEDNPLFVPPNPTFTADETSIFLFGQDPDTSDLFGATLVLNADKQYRLDTRVDLNFLKDNGGNPVSLVAGAVVLNNRKWKLDSGADIREKGKWLLIFSTGMDPETNNPLPSIEWVTILDLNKPKSEPQRQKLVVQTDRLLWGYTKNYPNFWYSSQHSLLHYKDRVWYTAMGQIAYLDLTNWTWFPYDHYNFPLVKQSSIANGSTITEDGRLFNIWRFNTEEKVSIKEYNLAKA